MQKSFIVVLITGLVVALFAVLNAKPVEVNLIFRTFEMSQAIVILISATLGAVAMFLMNIVQVMKLKKQVKQLSKKLIDAGINSDDVTDKKSKQKAKKEQAVEPAEKTVPKQPEKVVAEQSERVVHNSAEKISDSLNSIKDNEKTE